MSVSISVSNDQIFEQIIDLGRYPIDQPDSTEYRALIRSLMIDLQRNQVCQLPGFLQQKIRLQEVKSVLQQMPNANPAAAFRNIYLERSPDKTFPADHPRNLFLQASYKMLGAHLLDENSALKQLYHWQPFQRFVTEVTQSERLYPSADPYQPVNVLCHEAGDSSSWHFDSGNAFTMTLSLQEPEAGGVFEMAADIRSDENPNYDGVRSLLQGEENSVKRFQREPGAMMIFRGCHSAHRVTEVSGNTPRLMCVMVYEKRPGVIGDAVVNETVYGVSTKL